MIIDVGYGKIYDISFALGQGQWDNATSFINAFIPENVIEANFKTYFTIYNKMQTDSLGLNESDSTSLYQLAVSCVEDNGKIVYEARNLYNLYYGTNLQFIDNCNSSSSENRLITNKVNDALFSIFPNPSSNEVHILLKEGIADNLYKIIICDIQGRIFENVEIRENNRELLLTTNLSMGIYFIHLSSINNHDVQKLIIHN